MKDWDFGFYGKGARGYAHYKQAFDRTQKPGKPQTGGPHPGGPGSGLGCLLCGLGVVLAVAGLAGFAWLLDGLGALRPGAEHRPGGPAHKRKAALPGR